MDKLWGLIPARSNSKRVKGKNLRFLGDKPLLSWTIDASLQSGIFDRIIIATGYQEHEIASCYREGVNFFQRKAGLEDDSPDVEWIKEIFEREGNPQYFAILRPTSPFRNADDIKSAWQYWQQCSYAEALRSVKSSQNPYKMWKKSREGIIPAFHHERIFGQEVYNLPTQLLPQHYIQCGAIEICDSRNVIARNCVANRRIVPYFMDEINGFDINTEFDFKIAELMVKEGII